MIDAAFGLYMLFADSGGIVRYQRAPGTHQMTEQQCQRQQRWQAPTLKSVPGTNAKIMDVTCLPWRLGERGTLR
jgi:hypothetical protein